MQIISKLIAFTSVLVVARILTPEEIGVFAIVSSLAIIAVDLRFFGTGSFLIKEKEVTDAKKRSVLGVSIAISYGLGLLLIIGAPTLQNYFGYPDMASLFQIMSISFFIAPFFVVPHAILTKEYNFKKLLVISCSSHLLATIVTIYLITIDFSYFSLAITMNVSVLCQLILTYFLAPNYLIFRPSFKDVKEILNFGGYNSLSVIFNRLSFVVPDIIIGKMGSARDVAMYSRGLGFLDFLSQVLTMGFKPVALPFLSESLKNEEDVNKAYLRATNLISSICVPILAVATVSSYPIIILLFGDQWEEAVPLVSYLGIWMIFKMVHVFAPALFLASNKHKLLFYQKVFIFLLTAFSIICSYNSGLIAVAKAMAIAGVLEFFIISFQLKLSFQLKFSLLLKSLLPNIFLTLISFSVTYGLTFVVDFKQQSPALTLVMIALINIPIWIFATKLLKLEIYKELHNSVVQLLNLK
jgi:O-antigen/teichoic acid export membrane protein